MHQCTDWLVRREACMHGSLAFAEHMLRFCDYDDTKSYTKKPDKKKSAFFVALFLFAFFVSQKALLFVH